MKIEELDSNFKANEIGDKPVVFLDVLKAPFSVEGLPWPSRRDMKWPFARIPPTLTTEEVNACALDEGWHMTPGATVRFRSDSPYIAIRAELFHSCDMNHMPRAGSAGFDLYMGPFAESRHFGTAQPSRDEVNLERMLYERDADDVAMEEWTVNLPLYGGVSSIAIGLAPGSSVEPPPPHRTGKILFYGSSITQGGCASRPGNMYPSLLCRAVDAEQVNMGFSGSARGEIAMARAIAELGLAAFVYDYDCNAPSPEHLWKTHEPFFRLIRDKHPELPVLILSRCDIWPDRKASRYRRDCKRREAIRATYDHAIEAGDRHVYFIDGETLFGTSHRDACTVDQTHPNDLGFYRMFETVLPVLQKALEEA